MRGLGELGRGQVNRGVPVGSAPVPPDTFLPLLALKEGGGGLGQKSGSLRQHQLGGLLHGEGLDRQSPQQLRECKLAPEPKQRTGWRARRAKALEEQKTC